MRLLAIIAAMLIVGSAFAQEYTFKVLVNKGQNEIKAGNNWRPIRVGTDLQRGDELRISQNGYLGLVHVSGRPLEVKDAGQHKVMDLAARIKKGSSVLHQYTDFILSTTNEKRNNLTATGAVYRGSDEIKVFLPKAEHAIAFNEKISIAWAKDANSSAYVVRFNSMFGDELDKIEVQDTTLSVNLSGVRLANEDNILVEVSSKTDSKKKSEQFMIKKVSAADKARIKAALNDIDKVTAEETALNQLYLANFYERHTLLIDASTAYQKAIKLEPDVSHFQEAYAAFLVRNGLLKSGQ